MVDTKERYAEYLAGEHWQSMRLAKVVFDGRYDNVLGFLKCDMCNGAYQNGLFEVHHLTYERRGRERLEDLNILCIKCHAKVHDRELTRQELASLKRQGVDTTEHSKAVRLRRRLRDMTSEAVFYRHDAEQLRVTFNHFRDVLDVCRTSETRGRLLKHLEDAVEENNRSLRSFEMRLYASGLLP